MALYTVTGIVLRRTNFGEADRIVTIYSRERGKIPCIAKGVRKPISRLSGPTEGFTYGTFQLAEGRHLHIVSQADVKNSFQQIHCDLHKIAHASYISEMVDKLTEEHDCNPEIFDLLLSSLYLMERPNPPEKIAHMFALQFMGLLGYEPMIDCCLRCHAKLSGETTLFSPSMGGIVCRECGPIPGDSISLSAEAVTVMRILSVADAREVEKLEIPTSITDDIARAMRWYVRYRSDRDLKSAAFLESLRARGDC
jgi:DNA repair protein RecO (recombination protein O)